MTFFSEVGRSAFKLAFQLSPIVLVGGVAGDIGGMLPLISITESAHFVFGLLSGSDNLELDGFFAHFEPMAGATLVENQIATFPFANQAVAGNAIIRQPLNLSMKMICPARDIFGVGTKLATMMALKATLDQHNALGGTYTVVTPSYFYTNGILLGLRDITTGEGSQRQVLWQWDFTFPLLTLEDAQATQNSLISKITSGARIDGSPSWSGLPTTINSPDSLASSALIPAASGLPAANTAPFSAIPSVIS